ncbi:MAG TPA: hypothetical protein VJ870_17195 [Amycolatopsis sp.]|nr:hypothetical protein [Amycolatopsis sp.]
MTSEQINGRGAVCRFCGRPPRPGQHRAPGPQGPICTDCLEAGLVLVRDGRERRSLGGTGLARVTSITDDACEFCGRRDRRNFLGFHRPLARMSCAQAHATICADCLNRGGELINKYLRQRAY